MERVVELMEDTMFVDNYPLDVKNHEADAEEETTEKALTNAEWDVLLLEFEGELRSSECAIFDEMEFESYLLEPEGESGGGFVDENHTAVASRNAEGGLLRDDERLKPDSAEKFVTKFENSNSDW